MSGDLSPTALPTHVLGRADVQAALKRHDFGQVFKLARQWGGISFLKIADACDIKPERVGKLARGDGAITTYEKIAYIADALGIPGRMIGLAPRPWEQASTPTSASRPELISPLATVALGIANVPETGDLGTVDLEGDEVQRRRFLAASIGIATSAAMTPGATAGRRIGQRQVQHLQRRTVRLRSLDDVLGGADTRHIYRAELGTTMNLLRNASYTETTGRQLLSLVAEQARSRQVGQHSTRAVRPRHQPSTRRPFRQRQKPEMLRWQATPSRSSPTSRSAPEPLGWQPPPPPARQPVRTHLRPSGPFSLSVALGPMPKRARPKRPSRHSARPKKR